MGYQLASEVLLVELETWRLPRKSLYDLVEQVYDKWFRYGAKKWDILAHLGHLGHLGHLALSQEESGGAVNRLTGNVCPERLPPNGDRPG